ncbi:MAG: PGF-pre-PGF domain-containing protein [Methanosarcinaceae archaeon]|nr:PGF-pre-PGF domain-containing protein [Methanosarcinaceae archaeon]
MVGQTNYRKSTKKKGIISVSLTLFIILMLVFSGPASAVRIQMESPSGNYNLGDPVTFKVHVEFQTHDLIPISTINVTNLPKGDLSFSADGTQLSGSDDYDVTLTENTAAYQRGYGYGYGYGYDYDDNSWHNFRLGYGYGYGYDYGYGYGYDSTVSGPSKLTYEIKIHNLKDKTYSKKATIEVKTKLDQHVFSATQDYKFKVIRKSSGGGGGRGVANQFTQTQIFKIGVANFYGDAGKIVPSIKIPGATGSITVKKLTSNPTNVNTGKHVFFYLDINAGDNANKAATITFRLSKDSINEADIDPNTIALYRFNNGNWEELETQWSQTVDGYEEYTAQTPGFSAFLVSEKGAVPTVTATPTLTPAPTEEIEEPTPTSTKKGIPGFEAFGLITGVLMAAYIIMRKRG